MLNGKINSSSNITHIGFGHVILVITGVICTLICGMQIAQEGLELLFLLPVAFTLCSFLFYRAFSYWSENVAFIIIFATILVRYLVTPVLISLAGSALITVNPTAEYYRLAILIQIFELFVTLIIIDNVWTRHKKSINEFHKTAGKGIDFKLSWLGILFILALTFLVLVRGRLDSVFSHYSTWFYTSEDFSPIFFYDLISVEIIKSVLGITIISFFAKRYRKTSAKLDRFVCFVLAMIVGLAMTYYYNYEQRTALVQLIISSLVVLVAFFPSQRKPLSIVFVLGGGILLAYVFASGSMGYEAGGSNEGMLEELAEMAELYVTGPSMVAITQQKYSWVRENMTLSTYLSDIINSAHIFGMFPFLRGIHNMVADIPTTNQLFVESLGGLTYILPNYSLWTYYATNVLGWIFEAGSIYVTIRLICLVDKFRIKKNDACYYYALAYTETLLGQAIFVNNTFLLCHAFTNLPFWLLIFAFVNELGRKIGIFRKG